LGQRASFRNLSSNDFRQLKVALLFDASTVKRTHRTRPSMAAVQIVRKFDEFIGKVDQSRIIRILEVCDTLHVSRRTLHRAFHDVVRIGPMAFLRYSRLCSTRFALLNSDPQRTIVADVALQNGFEDAGRFSSYYLALFGEHPSVTLNRKGNGRKSAQKSLRSLPSLTHFI
jgi:AraC-like DNA-binding protein